MGTLPQSLPEGLSEIGTDAGLEVKQQHYGCSSSWVARLVELSAEKASCSLRIPGNMLCLLHKRWWEGTALRTSFSDTDHHQHRVRSAMALP